MSLKETLLAMTKFPAPFTEQKDGTLTLDFVAARKSHFRVRRSPITAGYASMRVRGRYSFLRYLKSEEPGYRQGSKWVRDSVSRKRRTRDGQGEERVPRRAHN